MGGMSGESDRASELVLSREQVRACDRVAIEQFGLCGLVLMENAGAAAAGCVLEELGRWGGGRVCVVAGTGNNGGDGFVAARHLANEGVGIEVLWCGSAERSSGGAGEAASNLAILRRMGAAVQELSDSGAAAAAIGRHGGEADVIVDALLGTGATGPPREPTRTAIEVLNRLGKPVVAIDIPSGLDCDTGEPMGAAVRAARTITFVALKKGFLNPAAAAYTGRVTVASIGIAAGLLRAAWRS